MTPWDVSIASGTGAASDDAINYDAPQSFSFDLDDDLTKVVTVWTIGTTCHVNVRYGRDVLVDEQDHVFEVPSPITIEQTPFGIIVHTTRRGFPWLGRRHSRKF